MDKPSLTALGSAFGRAFHATHVTPKIFDDALARHWFTESEYAGSGQHGARGLALYDPQAAAAEKDSQRALARLMEITAPIALSRARFAEDALLAGLPGYRQYVILGAGLDTFALRRTDLLERGLRVYEVDHPATQAMKRERMTAAEWAIPDGCVLLPADFRSEAVDAVLGRSGFDPSLPTFVSWLGVSYYLERPAFDATLAGLARCVPERSAVCFDYFETGAYGPAAAARMQRMLVQLGAGDEKPVTGFEPERLSHELQELGWELAEDLGPEAVQARYFQGRTDGYRAFEHVHLARAVRAGGTR